MRKKEERLIITFRTTAEAIAMEKACKERAVPGRLIPVPKEISAGCGLCWSTDPKQEHDIRKDMDSWGMKWESIQRIM